MTLAIGACFMDGPPRRGEPRLTLDADLNPLTGFGGNFDRWQKVKDDPEILKTPAAYVRQLG